MAKKAGKNTKKPAKKGIALTSSYSPPPTWYFPTGDEGMVMACDWNNDDKQYDKNCREIPMPKAPQHISTAIKTSLRMASK